MIFVFFFQSFSIPFPFHFHPILWKINGTKMERYIPLFAVRVENGMEWNGTPFCRPMLATFNFDTDLTDLIVFLAMALLTISIELTFLIFSTLQTN